MAEILGIQKHAISFHHHSQAMTFVQAYIMSYELLFGLGITLGSLLYTVLKVSFLNTIFDFNHYLMIV